MKMLCTGLKIISSALLALASLFFLVMEGSLLVLGDWRLYENSGLALLQNLLRFFVPCVGLAAALLRFAKSKVSFWWPGVCMFCASAAMAPFLSNGFGLWFLLLTGFFLISELAALRLLPTAGSGRSAAKADQSGKAV